MLYHRWEWLYLSTGNWLREKEFQRVIQENPDLHFQTRPVKVMAVVVVWDESLFCFHSDREKLGFTLALVCSGVVICLWGYSWRVLVLSSHVPFFYTHLYCALLMTEEKPFLQSLETLVYCTQFHVIFWPFCMEVLSSMYLCFFMRGPRAWAWTSDFLPVSPWQKSYMSDDTRATITLSYKTAMRL